MTVSAFKRVAGLAIVGLGVLLYARTLPFPFAFDDFLYLVNNPFVKEIRSFAYWGSLSSFATLAYRLGLDPDLSTNLILRPVTYFTFFLNYTIAGMNPPGFRMVNIAIHCVNGVLVFALLWLLLRSSAKRASISTYSAGFIALSSALLFISHPLQTESVTYIVQRFTSLGLLFYLSTLWLYFRSRTAATGRRAALLKAGSVTALVLGMLSKESVFTAPFVLVFIDWLAMGTRLKPACRSALPHLLCLPIVPILIVMTATAQNNGQVSFATALNVANSLDMGHSPYDYVLTQSRVVLTYLRLILLPIGLNLDPSYVPSRSLLEWRVIGSLSLIAALVGGSWVWFRRRPDDLRRALLLCSIVWYFVALAPSSSIVPLPDLMADHRTHLASVAMLTALACCVDMLRTRAARARIPRYYFAAGIVLWVSALSFATHLRNNVWRSEITLWRDTALKSPRKFRPWSNLGVAYFERNRHEEGIACMLRAIQLEPRFVNGYVNLSVAYNAIGQYRKAIDVAKRGLIYASGGGVLWYNKGLAYWQLGETNRSIQCLALATNLCRTDPRPSTTLGLVCTDAGRYEDALRAYQLAVSLRPDDPVLRDAVQKVEALLRSRETDQPAEPPAASTGGHVDAGAAAGVRPPP